MPGSRAKHACVTPTGGYFFEETTATSLVKVRFGEGTPPEGMLVGSDGTETVAKADVVNIGCVPVGRAIFDARADVNSIIHAHPHAVMAVSATKSGLLPLSQAAFFLHEQVGSYKYDFSYESEFEAAIAQQFARGKRAVMLEHHGLYAVGTSARESWFVTFHLHQVGHLPPPTCTPPVTVHLHRVGHLPPPTCTCRLPPATVASHPHQACEVQLRAQSTGQPLIVPAASHLDEQYAQMIASTDYA